MQPESYVVRVYRRGKHDPRRLTGIVEVPENGRRAVFRSLAELSAILAAPRRHLRPARAVKDVSTMNHSLRGAHAGIWCARHSLRLAVGLGLQPVDDDPLICSLGREILEHLGYRVEVAREGLEALRLYGENGGADLVILDFYLPGQNGFQVLKELKIMDPGARVLFASGFFSSQDLDRLKGEGASGLIRKTFRVSELQMQIRQALAGARGF